MSIDWDSMIQGDHDQNNPARLLDCPNCDGTYWPEDEKCSLCGYVIQSQGVVKN